MPNINLKLCAAFVALTFVGVNQAKADMVYTSPAGFAAATSSTTTIDFNGIAAPGSYVSYGTGPLTLSGVSFTGNNSMYVIDPGYYGFPYAGGGFLNSDYSSPDTIFAASLPAGTTAVGMNYGSLFSGGGTFTFTLSDGFSQTVSTPGSIQTNNLSFIGFTTTSSISSIFISMPDAPNYNALDNFVFGTAVSQPVPEPCSLALVCTGLATVGGIGWMKKRPKAATA